MKTFLPLLLSLAAIGSFAFAQSGDPLPALGKPILATATTPVNGTNEIQTLTFGGTPTAGTFTLAFKGKTTAAITWSATNSTLVSRIDSAFEALATVGTGGVTTAVGTMTSGIGTITLTFTGNLAKLAVPTVTVSSSLTGSSPTLSAAETTPGVTADGRSADPGQLLVDKGHAALYVNTSTTALNPAWTNVANTDAQLTLLATNTPTVAVADLSAVTQDTLTDSSGGSATTTLAAVANASAAVTDTTAASLTSVNTTIGVLKNAVATLAAELAKVKTDNAAQTTKINDLLAKLRTGDVVTP